MARFLRNKTYLGDGVYAGVDADDWSLVLTTENGLRETNVIVLEPEVLAALERYIATRRRESRRAVPAAPSQAQE